jgi:hypothetical protein
MLNILAVPRAIHQTQKTAQPWASKYAPSPRCGERYPLWLVRTGEVRSQGGLESGGRSLILVLSL